jgi:putative ABC transport system permease protein
MRAYMPPLTVSGIALSNLYARPFRSVCLLSLIALLSFVLTGGSLIARSLVRGVDIMSRRLGADLLVLPRGYDKAMEGILLRGESGSFYMDDDWVHKIAALEGVRRVSPQLFIASLDTSCCSMPVQLIGIDLDTDFVVGSWIQGALGTKLADGEIVIGSAVSGKRGDTLTFFDRDYRIAARLDRTGMGFDSSVFMTMNSARRAAGDRAASDEGSAGPVTQQAPSVQGQVSSILVAVEGSPRRVYDTIQSTFGYGESGIVPVLSTSIVTTVTEGLRGFIVFITVLAILLWITAVLVLTIVFCITLGERTGEFGMLRALGATRKKLIRLVLCESALISLAGSITGILFSLLVILPFGTLIGEVTRIPYVLPSIGGTLGVLALSLGLSFIPGPLASLYPALKIGRMDAYTVIQKNGL